MRPCQCWAEFMIVSSILEIVLLFISVASCVDVSYFVPMQGLLQCLVPEVPKFCGTLGCHGALSWASQDVPSGTSTGSPGCWVLAHVRSCKICALPSWIVSYFVKSKMALPAELERKGWGGTISLVSLWTITLSPEQSHHSFVGKHICESHMQDFAHAGFAMQSKAYFMAKTILMSLFSHCQSSTNRLPVSICNPMRTACIASYRKINMLFIFHSTHDGHRIMTKNRHVRKSPKQIHNSKYNYVSVHTCTHCPGSKSSWTQWNLFLSRVSNAWVSHKKLWTDLMKRACSDIVSWAHGKWLLAAS